MVRTTIEDAVCPACQAKGMEYNAEQIDLPYFGESLETMLRCGVCGYRHVDFVLTQTKDPTRHSYVVRQEDDMMVRVIRSASGTIRIPELGIDIEPGVASDAFITNIEGILNRIDRILNQLRNDAADDEMLQKVLALQETLVALRAGTGPEVTLVLEDPFGNSAIAHDDALVETLSPEEAAELQTGHHIIDQPASGDDPTP